MINWIAVAAGSAAQGILAGVFCVSAMSKIRSLRSLSDVIITLGLRPAFARPLAAVVLLAEVAAAIALAVLARAFWPRLLVAVLAVCFAGAGALALLGHRRITCNCFGNLSGARLGWKQVAWLPIWLSLAGIAQWRPPAWSATDGILGLDALLLCLVLRALIVERGHWRMVRGSRLASGATPTDPSSPPLSSRGAS